MCSVPQPVSLPSLEAKVGSRLKEDMTRSFETDIMMHCTDKVGAVVGGCQCRFIHSHDDTDTFAPIQNINDSIRAMRSGMFGESEYKGDSNYTVSSYLYTMVSGLWRPGIIVFSTV